jgi:hypothetical protein
MSLLQAFLTVKPGVTVSEAAANVDGSSEPATTTVAIFKFMTTSQITP